MTAKDNINFIRNSSRPEFIHPVSACVTCSPSDGNEDSQSEMRRERHLTTEHVKWDKPAMHTLKTAGYRGKKT